MAITAKELAAELGLSPAAVSMALNGKPGVSTATRKRVLELARLRGLEIPKGEPAPAAPAEVGTISLVVYRKHGAVLADTPFFYELISGIEAACRQAKYVLNIHYLTEELGIRQQLERLSYCNGMILLATEMRPGDFAQFDRIKAPIVVLDAYYESLPYNCVLINNFQGAYLAANHVMRKTHTQAGYLRSSYPIGNFAERADGFYKAVRDNGYSASKSPVVYLAPSIDGAYHDLLSALDQGEQPVRCYFADNDLIAVGAIRALQERGYRIPQDVAVVGFDDMPVCTQVDPPLTTVRVPKEYMGSLAVERVIQLIRQQNAFPVKIEVSTSLVKRGTV